MCSLNKRNSQFIITLEDDSEGVDGLVDKDAGEGREMVGILGGEILAGAATAAMALNFGMTLQVVGETFGNNRSLLDNLHMLRLVAVDFVDKQGIVGATQNDAVDVGTVCHQLVDVFLDKVVGTVAIALTVLDQWHPHGAGMTMDLEIGVHPFNLDVIAAAGDGAWCAEHADVACAGFGSHIFHRGTYNAQHAALGSQGGEVLLLDGAQRLGRGGVASQDDEVAALSKQVFHSL